MIKGVGKNDSGAGVQKSYNMGLSAPSLRSDLAHTQSQQIIYKGRGGYTL